jgi:hypothetical protein
MIFVESALVQEVGRLITVSVVRKITRVKPSKVDAFSVFVVLHVTTLPQHMLNEESRCKFNFRAIMYM